MSKINNGQRTLAEWMGILSQEHKAHQEYIALIEELEKWREWAKYVESYMGSEAFNKMQTTTN